MVLNRQTICDSKYRKSKCRETLWASSRFRLYSLLRSLALSPSLVLMKSTCWTEWGLPVELFRVISFGPNNSDSKIHVSNYEQRALIKPCSRFYIRDWIAVCVCVRNCTCVEDFRWRYACSFYFLLYCCCCLFKMDAFEEWLCELVHLSNISLQPLHKWAQKRKQNTN